MSNSYHKNLVFTAACIGMCFFGVSMITLGSVLPALVSKLGLSGLQATSLVTFLPLGMLIGSVIFGPIVDRFGHKALLVPGCIIVLLGVEGLIFFRSVPLLQVSIVGIGLGGGILNGETNALVSDISGESEKGSRLSFLGMFYGLGALGIPSLLGILSEYYSFETILQGIGLIMLAGILFCIPVRFPTPKQAQGFPVKEGLGLLKESALLLLSLVLFFQSGIEGVCNNWSTSYLGRMTDIPANRALIVLTCMVAGLTIARMLQIVIFKKVQPAKVLPYSLILTAIGFGLLTASPGFLRAATGMVLIGMGLSPTYPVILSILGTRYPALSGTAFSIALAIALVGQTCMNGLMGMISVYDNGIALYPYMMIGSLVVMLIIFLRVPRKR
ncbi:MULTISPECIES: MFS transporter [Bacteroides]|uniref:MFS transporter n=1 Tax=Bacteroides TaxID=816 RepID=UPI000E44B6CF|nr:MULTISPECIES: MFS transporter [Bacteroides]MBS7572998.1 MFS transporter [Bacteroides propionicigenes]RGM29221.1 MFS transporter [Bacteroides sp. OM08-17BH]HBO06773.1 MFS transporter [Bacteroides sp.]